MHRGRKYACSLFVLVAIALWSLGAPLTNAAESCSGGDAFQILETVGDDDDESGVGGTGHTDATPRAGKPDSFSPGEDDDSGTGGTGFRPDTVDDEGSGLGGTGIFGRVSRTNELCVNGFEIVVPSQLAIKSSRESAANAMLAVGQLVWVRAASQDGRLVAQQIVIQVDGDPSDVELVEEILNHSRGLDYVSVETYVGGSAKRPSLGGIEFALGPMRDQAIRDGLQPGALVRVGGRLDAAGRFEVAQPPRLERPLRSSEDGSETTRERLAPVPTPAPEKPDADRTRDTPKAPHPAVDRPRSTIHSERPERPEKPDLPDRPDRPDRLERPERRTRDVRSR